MESSVLLDSRIYSGFTWQTVSIISTVHRPATFMFHSHDHQTGSEPRVVQWNEPSTASFFSFSFSHLTASMSTAHWAHTARLAPIFYLRSDCANEWHLSSGTCDIWSLTPSSPQMTIFGARTLFIVCQIPVKKKKKRVARLLCCLNLFPSAWTITQLLHFSSPLISFLFLSFISVALCFTRFRLVELHVFVLFFYR